MYSGADSTGNKQQIKRHNRKQQKNKQKITLPAQINTVVAASNTNLEVVNGKPRQLDMMAKPTDGRLVKDGLVFQQNFTIRSFDMGSDFKITTEASMNFLQETALNHARSVRILADGFGSTLQMSIRNLIWVICRLQIEVDCYSSWGDVIQIDTWMYASGKNGLGRDWHVRDFKTGKTLTRATGVYLMMDKTTRKVSKFIEEAREEINPFAIHCDPIIHNNNNSKLLKLDIDKADQVRTGLIPGRTDMDINQHVSHIKYLNYVLEPCRLRRRWPNRRRRPSHPSLEEARVPSVFHVRRGCEPQSPEKAHASFIAGGILLHDLHCKSMKDGDLLTFIDGGWSVTSPEEATALRRFRLRWPWWPPMGVLFVASSCNYSLLNMFQSVPHSVVESHELFEITLEYRKECNRGSVLQSFSRIISDNNNERMEFDHLLCLEGGQEIMRGRTTWRPKYSDSSIEKV
ncbi:hypothetical protein EZV62_004089 [Acer yangbiense]|uniref:Acyl-[acyl-carrier-protein] hydrolase n=1 Tax=Acer yangbiense TaxID=1000413 RepID=A0A5C7IJX5_9ROSI|nr:hypothetical protein EZV62_004089 [Acer yangbiense]